MAKSTKIKKGSAKKPFFGGPGDGKLKLGREMQAEAQKHAQAGRKGFCGELRRAQDGKGKPPKDVLTNYQGQDVAERRKEVPNPKLMKENPAESEKDDPHKGFPLEMLINAVPKR